MLGSPGRYGRGAGASKTLSWPIHDALLIAVNLRRLRYFVTVAEELHFGRAATRLYVSQPALSHQIRKLEQALGVRLLDRTSRSVALTDAGADVLAEARAVLAGAERLQATADRHRAPTPGTLAIGFTGSAASRLLPAILERFRALLPAASVSLRELVAERYDLLRTADLDVVIGRLRPEEMPDLDVLVLAEEPRVAALPADHPLAGRASLELVDLAADAFITQPAALNAEYRRRWLAEQHAAGLPGRIAAEASSIQEFLNLVAAGRGVCLAPAAAAEFNPWPGVCYVPVDGIAPATTSVATRAGHESPAVVTFRVAARAASGREDTA